VARLREVVPDTEICQLIQHLVNRRGVGPAARRIRSGKGLHQGSSLSPVLTNLYLDAFDRDLLNSGHRVLRYSDDFAIPVTTHHQGEQILELTTEALRRLDLELNEAKSRIESFDEGVDFLGKTTTRSPRGQTHRRRTRRRVPPDRPPRRRHRGFARRSDGT
jgi:CRISP-associated protein Cas1